MSDTLTKLAEISAALARLEGLKNEHFGHQERLAGVVLGHTRDLEDIRSALRAVTTVVHEHAGQMEGIRDLRDELTPADPADDAPTELERLDELSSTTTRLEVLVGSIHRRVSVIEDLGGKGGAVELRPPDVVRHGELVDRVDAMLRTHPTHLIHRIAAALAQRLAYTKPEGLDYLEGLVGTAQTILRTLEPGDDYPSRTERIRMAHALLQRLRDELHA